MPLAAVTFFPASYPRLAREASSAARTDWESMIAAVGAGLRPASSLTCPCIVSVDPSACHFAAHQYTVQAGGKSAGRARHTGPLCVR